MKKNGIIILLSITLLSIFIYMNVGQRIDFEVLTKDNTPEFIQTAIQNNDTASGFSIFQDESNTYIYYKADSAPNEYITVDVDLRVKGGKYTATATVNHAVNVPNTDSLLKVEKLEERDIILKAKINR